MNNSVFTRVGLTQISCQRVQLYLTMIQI